MLDLGPDAPLDLTTPLNDAAPVPVARFSSNANLLGDTTTLNRAPVRQAAQTIASQEAALRVARASRLPTVSLVSNWGRVGYPAGFFPGWNDFATNWTVGAQLSVPVLTGGRLRGDRMVAEAAVLEARAQFEGTKQLAVLDTRNALLQLAAARAQWQASAGTVEQANRAYQIAEIRYREGLSTQTELTDSRILLQQAQANRAQAARDLQIAQVHVALLPDLPISIGQGSAAQQQSTQQQAAPQQAQPQQTQPQTQPQQAANAFSTTGGVP
jgi:outer membrane protein TolC